MAKSIPLGGVPVLDWSSPLTRGLVACYLPGSVPTNQDLTGYSPTLSTKISTHWTLGPSNLGGRGAGVPGTAAIDGVYATIGTTGNLCLPGPLSIYVLAYVASVGTTETLTGVRYTGTPGTSYSTPFVGYGFRSSSSNWLFSWNIGGTAHFVTGPATSLPIGDRISFLGTLPTSGSAVFYSDGVSVATASAVAGSISYTSTSAFCIGSLTNANCRNLHYLVCVWNRALSAYEAASLDAGPFQFLIWPQDQMAAYRGANRIISMPRLLPAFPLAIAVTGSIGRALADDHGMTRRRFLLPRGRR